jgi:hypothetical protein
MNLRSSVVVVLWLLSTAAGAYAGQTAPASLSLDEYVALLDRLALAVGQLDEGRAEPIAEVLAGVPRAWDVATPGRTWTVSAEWLRRDLAALRGQRDAAARMRIVDRLQMLRSEAASFRDPASEVSSARATLAGILARREFRNIHGPSWLDRLRQRALQWLLGLFDWAVGSSSIPAIMSALVYAVIGLAVLLIGLWISRTLRQGAAVEATPLSGDLTSPKPWAAWLADARSAAAGSHWREAVRLAYWCAITFLEDRGAWRLDHSRTPREYLRLLPPSSDHVPALQTLTRMLERMWYGTDPADAAAFDEALAQLKKLGCPSI